MAKRKQLPRSTRNAQIVRDNADEILAEMRKGGKMLLGDLFHGDQYAAARAAIKKVGSYRSGGGKNGGGRELKVQTRPIDGTDEHEVLAIAAVSRNPGRADDFLDTIEDYQTSGKDRPSLVQMYWNIYKNEGVVNNATNKISAILSGGGSFKVRRAKKGKARKAAETLLQILDWWSRNVNSSPLDGVITGARGLKAVNHQGVRQALVEGSWVGRQVWVPAEVSGLGRFDLPMNIQSITTAELEPLKGLAGTDAEAFYWKPSRNLIKELTNPTDKDTGKILKRYVPSDIVAKLKKDGKALLDSSLLTHIKHRGNGQDQFGESLIQSALTAIAYSRSIDQLDVVSMQNIINRLTIVMVGSSDPKSPYSKVEVAQARAALMQSFFDEPGPNMTIIWQGDDVNVKDVGAHSAVLALDDRHNIAAGKIKISLGVPDALLTGSTADGKAAGWAASIGAAAELEELQNAFAQAWTTLAERIAVENGFTDIELIYEFDHTLIVDRMAERNQVRNDYTAGALSIRSYLESIGRDPEAEFQQKCFEKGLDPNDETVTWEEAFMPPQGLQGQGPGKVPGNGRTPNNQTGKTTPDRTPAPSITENK